MLELTQTFMLPVSQLKQQGETSRDASFIAKLQSGVQYAMFLRWYAASRDGNSSNLQRLMGFDFRFLDFRFSPPSWSTKWHQILLRPRGRRKGQEHTILGIGVFGVDPLNTCHCHHLVVKVDEFPTKLAHVVL